MKYEGKDNYGKLKKEYLDRLSEMDDDSLFDETKNKIWLSAYASNNRRNFTRQEASMISLHI